MLVACALLVAVVPLMLVTRLAWVVAAVAGLQTLLATTGYCVGCRLYFLRWWVPDFVTRIWTRGASSANRLTVEPIQYK